MNLELSPLFVHIPLLIVNIYFEFQVYMFSNGRDNYDKMSQFLNDDDNHDDDGNDNRKAITTPQVFSENSRAE